MAKVLLPLLLYAKCVCDLNVDLTQRPDAPNTGRVRRKYGGKHTFMNEISIEVVRDCGRTVLRRHGGESNGTERLSILHHETGIVKVTVTPSDPHRQTFAPRHGIDSGKRTNVVRTQFRELNTRQWNYDPLFSSRSGRM